MRLPKITPKSRWQSQNIGGLTLISAALAAALVVWWTVYDNCGYVLLPLPVLGLFGVLKLDKPLLWVSILVIIFLGMGLLMVLLY